MKIPTHKFLLVLAALFITSFNVSAAVECAPEVPGLLVTDVTYKKLYTILQPDVALLKTRLDAVINQPTYAVLLTFARVVANDARFGLAKGRLLITLADGTVVVDTNKLDDPTNTKPVGNSFKHFSDKTVNENHNSRIAILDSQLHVCGLGVETKLSTTDHTKESYVAIRLGAHLNNSGTARLSVKQ
jgi:hypothetical protein